MNWFNYALITICVFILLLALISARRKQSETSPWAMCACGHASSWHSISHSSAGGCKSKDVNKDMVDPYGYCTCPRTHDEVEERSVG